jgi:PAS domain S-box-containing protein
MADALCGSNEAAMNSGNLLPSPPGEASGATSVVSFDEALTSVCLVAEAQWPDLMAAIYVLDRSCSRWQVVAAPHLPEGWRQRIHGTSLERGGPYSAAIARRRRIVVADMAADPLYSTLNAAAQAAGLRACWASPLMTSAGRPLGVFALYARRPRRPGARDLPALDRTTDLARVLVERHCRERERQSSARRWHAIFDSSAVGIALTGVAGRFVTTSHAFRDLVGYRDAELQRMTWLDLIPAEHHALIVQRAQDLFSGAVKEARHEHRCTRREGGTVWLRVTSTLMPETGRDPPYLMALVEDVTARKRAELDLRRTAAQLAEAQRIGRTGSWVMNLATHDLLWSQEMFHIWGLDPDRGAPTPELAHERLHPEDRDRVLQGVRRRIREAAEFEGEHRLLLPDGSVTHVCYSGRPVFDAAGFLVEYIGTVRDMTSEKQVEERLRATVAEVRSLAARQMQAQDDERRRIGRELHETTAQDLAALKLTLAALDRTGGMAGSCERALIEESAALAERSMNDIRTLSYLLHPPFLDEVGLAPALRWYAMGFAKRSGVAVELDVPEQLPRFPREVETTLFRFVQECLINIHRHARSHAAAIRLRASSLELVTEVQDWGSGMPAGDPEGPEAPDAAMGVGIAGMRVRVRHLNGALEIESGADGTTMRARLPLHPAVA